MADQRDAAIVPGISTQSSAVAVRSLGRAGITPIVATDGQRSPATASKYCTEVVEVPDPIDSMDGYARGLLELAERADVRTVIPLREADAYALAANRGSFARHLDPAWPDLDTLRTAQDRRALLSIADDLHVPVPQTRLLTDWPSDGEPLVVKPRYSIVVDDDSTSHEPDVRVLGRTERPSKRSIIDEMGHVPVVQEYVPTDGEFGFFALMDHGDPVVTFQHRRVRSFSYTGGASVYREAIDDPELRSYGETLLSALDWHGPAMVEFRRDARDGSFVLMEINPRFWGSLALPVHAGVDFPRHYVELATGDLPDADSVTYEVGVGSHLLSGEVAYLYNVARGTGHGECPSLLRELVAVSGSVVREPRFDLLSIDDPMPFAADLASMAALAGDRVAGTLR